MSETEVDRLLEAARGGDAEAERRLFGLLYDELRRMAAGVFRGRRGDHTLQPTALLHEAFLKLARSDRGGWNDRDHFMAVAARAMRQVLVNHARDRAAAKRGGPDARRVTLSGVEPTDPSGVLEVLALDDALARLTELDERQGRIAELRLFGGLEIQAIADHLGVSKRTVELDWRVAKQWLGETLR